MGILAKVGPDTVNLGRLHGRYYHGLLRKNTALLVILVSHCTNCAGNGM